MYRQDLTLQQAVTNNIPEKCIFQIVVADMSDGGFCTCHFWALKTVPIHITVDGRKSRRTWRISLLKRVVFSNVSQLVCPISEASRAWMFSLVKMWQIFTQHIFAQIHGCYISQTWRQNGLVFQRFKSKKWRKILLHGAHFVVPAIEMSQFFSSTSCFPKKKTPRKFRTWFPTGRISDLLWYLLHGDGPWMISWKKWMTMVKPPETRSDGLAMRRWEVFTDFFVERGDSIERKRRTNRKDRKESDKSNKNERKKW